MTKISNFEKVGDFMEAFGQSVEMDPTWPDFNTRDLRLELISEEFSELCQAIEDRDMIQIADALTDLLYVCLLYTSPSPRDLSTSRMPSSA